MTPSEALVQGSQYGKIGAIQDAEILILHRIMELAPLDDQESKFRRAELERLLPEVRKLRSQ